MKELFDGEYAIPEGYTVSVENGKIIVKKEESEDETIRKAILEHIQLCTESIPDRDEFIAWLEKQNIDISSFPKEQQVFMRKYVSLDKITLIKLLAERDANNAEIIESFEKQGEQNQKHFELKAGHWYICHRAFCCRADHLTVKEGERFMCEKDGIVKGFVLKEPEKYFKEVCAPAPIEDEQTPAWSEEDERLCSCLIEEQEESLDNVKNDKYEHSEIISDLKEMYRERIDWLKSIKDRVQPQWKPSKEELNALDIAKDRNDKTGWHLCKLYKQLKKL